MTTTWELSRKILWKRQSKFDCLIIIYEVLFIKVTTKANFDQAVWLHPCKIVFIVQSTRNYMYLLQLDEIKSSEDK